MNQDSYNAWLTMVQRDIPLDRRPFAVIGDRFGMSEGEVISKLQSLFDEGKARRVGGVFDVRGVGYRSALCAATVPEADLERHAAALFPQPGMTHCYQRGWPEALGSDLPEQPPEGIPNLWFTLSAQGPAFDVTTAAIRADLAPAPFFVMPAVRHFKIDVVFETGGGASDVAGASSTPSVTAAADLSSRRHKVIGEGGARTLSEGDKALIRAMQGLISLVPAPYDEIAEGLGRDLDDVIDCLREWKEAGVLRRVGVILRHRKMGFSANGMCVWYAPPERVAQAGKTLAGFRDVTHCYEREVIPGFPYNLFAMTHAGSYESALEKFKVLSQAAGLTNGRVLFSLREFKKTSPRYFCEDATA
jgi:siroheme decarboxylase